MAASSTNKVDQRAQIAALKAEESAANTLTVALFNFPFSVMDKMALNIHRIEYWPSWELLGSSGDQVTVALISAKTVTSIYDQSDPVIIDSMNIGRLDGGVAATAMLNTVPYVKNFSQLPGGGLLCPPNPLGVAIQGIGLASAGSAWVRIHYTYMQLSTDEYWQLVEARRVISNT